MKIQTVLIDEIFLQQINLYILFLILKTKNQFYCNRENIPKKEQLRFIIHNIKIQQI